MKRQTVGWAGFPLLLLALAGGARRLAGQGFAPAVCAEMRQRLAAVDARTTDMDDVAKRNELLKFLASLPDDPEDCATRAARSKLVDVETGLVQLRLGSASIDPDWLYQCHGIDASTQKCLGGSPYEDEIPRDTNEVLRTGHPVDWSDEVGRVSIAPGVACRVQAVSVSEFEWFFVKGHPARVLSRDGRDFRMASLRGMRSPVLLAAMRCDDALRFRKAAWLLRWKK